MTIIDEPGTERAYVQFRLANFWQAKGKIKRAMSGYQNIVLANPHYVPAQLELGYLLHRQGQLAEAEAHFRRAISSNPGDLSLKNGLISVLAEQVEPDNRAVAAMESFYLRPHETSYHIMLYTDRPGLYGAEQIGHMLMMALAANGYAVTCVQPFATHHLIDERSGVGIQHLWLAPEGERVRNELPSGLSNHEEVERIIDLARPDLIIFNDGSPFSNLSAKETAVWLEVPYVIITHLVTADWVGAFDYDIVRLPDIYRQAQTVVAVSQENLDLLHRNFCLPHGMGQVILNGRPDSYFVLPDISTRRRVRLSLDIPSEAVVVLTTGRMETVKGYQYQIEAIRKLRQGAFWQKLFFLWAGKGSFESQLMAFVGQGGIERQVKFLGERTDVPDLLDASDIFLLPSEFEGMPLSILEAMAKGLPVIATAVSGIPEALGDTGRLLPDPRRDPQATVAELVAALELWASNATLREAAGRASQRRAEILFAEDKMLARYLEIVGEIENGKRE